MKTFIIFCVSLAISGCAVFNGTPDPVLDVDKTVARYSAELERLANHPPQDCKGVKSAVDQALTALDLRYAEFINDISLEGRTKTTATDFALIGLGLAGTAVGGAEAKTILHAISTGVAGANTSIDKNYFYEKTIPALISQMNADRKEKLSVIVQRYANCDSANYSWFEAIHDLNDYYAAGTLLGALTSIPKNAGEREAVAEKDIKDALKFTLSKNTPVKRLLREALRNHEQNAIMKCWKKVNPDLFSGNSESECAKGSPSAARLINAAQCQQYQAGVLDCLEAN